MAMRLPMGFTPGRRRLSGSSAGCGPVSREPRGRTRLDVPSRRALYPARPPSRPELAARGFAADAIGWLAWHVHFRICGAGESLAGEASAACYCD
jgi:hypothetical protein